MRRDGLDAARGITLGVGISIVIWAVVILALTGCMVSGTDVLMPDDPEFAVVCDVEEPAPECWGEATITIVIENPFYTPADTTGGG